MSATSQQSSTTTSAPAGGCTDGFERVRFFPRQMITADDLNQEQNYHREKHRMHNRLLHGWGVVCGCIVGRDLNAATPLGLLIEPGFVITPQGDEILIGSQATFDLGTCVTQSSDPCVVTRPCPPLAVRAPTFTTLYLAVSYVECRTRPVRIAPLGCTCDEVDCEYSRICDGYQFSCLTTPPQSPLKVECAELCNPNRPFECPRAPTTDSVVLATITLSAPAGTASPTVTEVNMMENRQLLYSTANLQTLAANCLCQRLPSP